MDGNVVGNEPGAGGHQGGKKTDGVDAGSNPCHQRIQVQVREEADEIMDLKHVLRGRPRMIAPAVQEEEDQGDGAAVLVL